MYEMDNEKEHDEWESQHTMTVGELMDVLSVYPKDMKVLTTWESTIHTIRRQYIYESHTGNLYIDADEAFYRKDFEKAK